MDVVKEFFSENTIFLIGMLVIIGIGIFLGEIIKQQVKQAFDAARQRRQDREMLENSVRQLVDKVERLIDTFADHKHYDEEFRLNLEKTVNYKLNVQSAKIMDIMISEREHYKEIKGKIEKQWAAMNKMQNDITEIKTAHDMYYCGLSNKKPTQRPIQKKPKQEEED